MAKDRKTKAATNMEGILAATEQLGNQKSAQIEQVLKPRSKIVGPDPSQQGLNRWYTNNPQARPGESYAQEQARVRREQQHQIKLEDLQRQKEVLTAQKELDKLKPKAPSTKTSVSPAKGFGSLVDTVVGGVKGLFGNTGVPAGQINSQSKANTTPTPVVSNLGMGTARDQLLKDNPTWKGAPMPPAPLAVPPLPVPVSNATKATGLQSLFPVINPIIPTGVSNLSAMPVPAAFTPQAGLNTLSSAGGLSGLSNLFSTPAPNMSPQDAKGIGDPRMIAMLRPGAYPEQVMQNLLERGYTRAQAAQMMAVNGVTDAAAMQNRALEDAKNASINRRLLNTPNPKAPIKVPDWLQGTVAGKLYQNIFNANY